MARKESDNFYRRQQEEANRIATKQHRVLADIAALVKSSNAELRKLRQGFEKFVEAVLAQQGKIAPATPATPATPVIPATPERDVESGKVLEEAVRAGATSMGRLGYGDTLTSPEARRLVIGVDLSQDDPAMLALIGPRDIQHRRTIIADEDATRELLLTVEHRRDLDLETATIEDADNAQRAAIVEEVRVLLEKWQKAQGGNTQNDTNAHTRTPISDSPAEEAAFDSVLAEADEAAHQAANEDLAERIKGGQHPPAMFEVPEVAPVKTNRDGTRSYVKQEVLPPGVTPKMMEKHPEFAERIRNSPHYHQANQDASQRAKREPTQESTQESEPTSTPDANPEAAQDKPQHRYARGGYTGVPDGDGRHQLAGIVHPASYYGTRDTLETMQRSGLLSDGAQLFYTDEA